MRPLPRNCRALRTFHKTMMKVWKGIFHIHSNFSYDGKLPIEQIVKLCKKNGINFLILTEHIYDRDKKEFMSDGKIESFIKECASFSEEDFHVVPAVEIPTPDNKIHIIGVGIKKPINTDKLSTPLKILSELKEKNCLTVLAHPLKNKAIAILKEEELNMLNGIEIWNIKEEGRFIPDMQNYSSITKVANRYKDMFCYAGIDFHLSEPLSAAEMIISADIRSSDELLEIIKKGNFYFNGKFITFNSKGEIQKAPVSYIVYAFCKLLYGTKRILSKLRNR